MSIFLCCKIYSFLSAFKNWNFYDFYGKDLNDITIYPKLKILQWVYAIPIFVYQ